MASDKLTKKQNAFAEDIGYAKYEFDNQAYKANYNCKNMSENAISRETWMLLQNPKISQRIQEIKSSIVKRNEITVDEVLKELASWLRFDPLELIDPETEALLPLRNMTKEARMSLAEIHIQELWEMQPLATDPKKKVKTKIGELKKIKFVDKRATAEMFMKKFGQYAQEQNDRTDNLETLRGILQDITGIVKDK